MKNKMHQMYYHGLMFPGMLLLTIFSIVPMLGVVMAFQKFSPAKGILDSKFVGWANFEKIFLLPDSKQIIINTLTIASWKIILHLIIPLLFALILNECRIRWFKRTVQTIVYLPNFLSWVIVSVMISNILSPDGLVNQLFKLFGRSYPILFLVDNDWFRQVLVTSDIWKGFGYGAIIYLAAIMNIDSSLYEASEIDGATRWQQMRYITLPGIMTTVVLVATLSLGNVLNAGFEQVFTMYSPMVYRTGDIIDTYVYRVGLVQLQYSFATAVGLMKSVISLVLIIISYRLASKYANYRIF